MSVLGNHLFRQVSVESCAPLMTDPPLKKEGCLAKTELFFFKPPYLQSLMLHQIVL